MPKLGYATALLDALYQESVFGIRFVNVCLAVVVVTSSLACRSSVDTKVSKGASATQDIQTAVPPTTPPHGEPVEVTDGLGASRSYYQSRSVVSLNATASAVRMGERFSLVNETTGSTLIDQNAAALAILGDERMQRAGWDLLDAYEVTIKIYLLDPAFANKFSPGENNLRLLVADDGAGRTAKTKITVRDFPIFGFTTGTFASGEQRVKGFQGSFESIGKSTVTSGGQGFLATGFLSISNQ